MYILNTKIKWSNFQIIFTTLILTMVVSFMKALIDVEIGKATNNLGGFCEKPVIQISCMYASGLLNVLSIAFAAIFGSVASLSYLRSKPSSYIRKQFNKIAKSHLDICDSSYKFEIFILGISASKSFENGEFQKATLINDIDKHLILLGDLENSTKMSVSLFAKESREFWYKHLLEVSCADDVIIGEKLNKRDLYFEQIKLERLFFDRILKTYKYTKN
ncbi:hypothetical protein FC756_08325 [Lysinibacillus mangiferihumi]|uniref:Uncharacterized protein n=1 Tax=Lysinibacillus mangiferihumi TaxID=1130819 RepID=A0A4U2Z945_9BACI|nr:hypothetical protein [Lysinibacillus mangiferihumi]TKI70102.1 hypothetical protein FC756_08325 [Lysinibacillus mangiferihumi]